MKKRVKLKQYNSSTYRLPPINFLSQEYTNDVRKYAKAWRDLFEKMNLPEQYVLSGFDPGFLIYDTINDILITLPTSFVYELGNIIHEFDYNGRC